MATSAWSAVVDAATTTATTALQYNDSVRVVRGRDVTNDPSDVVMLAMDLAGFQNLGFVNAGGFQQGMQTFGGGREETGSVNGLVLARNGNADQSDAADNAFAYLGLLEVAVRTDPKLGLTAYDYVVAEMSSGIVAERQSDDGATAVLPFVITYKIRI